jgi:hypothetical protein
MFDTEEKSSKCLLEILTLELSANNTGHNVQFVLRERVICLYYGKQSPRIDPWGTYVSMYHSKRKNVEMK